MKQDEILKLAKEHSGFATGRGDEVLTVHFDVDELTNFANAIQSHSGGEPVAIPYAYEVASAISGKHLFHTENGKIASFSKHSKSEIKITELYLAPIDQSARIKELEADLIKVGKENASLWFRNDELQATNAELVEVLQEMVDMMDSGDEHGAGSEWHIKATNALTKAGD